MVNLFGSEKQKRAFSAAKRNLVEEGELDAALATAISHVKKEVEGVASGMTYHIGIKNLRGGNVTSQNKALVKASLPLCGRYRFPLEQSFFTGIIL